ncbi:hypothetical protein M5362_00810 [Streptomyces sp. Je 1-79]|uniref:hypothetical protein n=1 Tax=Streptomyces sp. Je 1-79 TaxID=2943847 RepID=UPI0021A3EE33|nr:hypothetical protein [Streptomyces sp. Je 1-79]MCT4351672.1 hypothetical protein [Streptomyces sp. Je 1-79]
MSASTDPLTRLSALWQAPEAPPRWVVWHASEGEVMVFDRELNIPADVDDASLAEVVRRMRAAGAPESDDYPGRPC